MTARSEENAVNGRKPDNNLTDFANGDREFHQKYGMGNIRSIDGDKLEIAFDKAGHKKVVAGFVSKP